MLLKAKIVSVLACLWLGLGGLFAESPQEVVRALHGVLSSPAAQEGSFDARCQAVRQAIETAYAMPAVAQIVLGVHWQELTPTERESFLELFTDYTVANYVSRLANRAKNQGPSRYEVLPKVTDLSQGRVMVRLKLMRDAGTVVMVDYVLRPEGESWKIIGMTAAGVSNLATSRADFDSVIKREGKEKLFERLRQKIDELSKL